MRLKLASEWYARRPARRGKVMSHNISKDTDTLDLFRDFEMEEKTSPENPEPQVLQAPLKRKTPSPKAKSQEVVALHPTQERYLTDKDVGARFGVCRQTVWRWIQKKTFPEPVKLTQKSTRWKLSDLVTYEVSLSGGSKSARQLASLRGNTEKEGQP